MTARLRLDGTRHVALAAFSPPETDIVAVARFLRTSDESAVAEVAITVADLLQQRGLGGAMAAALAHVASNAGMTTSVAPHDGEQPRDPAAARAHARSRLRRNHLVSFSLTMWVPSIDQPRRSR